MANEDVWARLEAAYRDEQPVTGMIRGVLGGFLEVDLDGIVAGLPLAKAGWRPPRDPQALVGQTLEVEIELLNREKGNVLVSRLALLQRRRECALRSLTVGAVVDATVRGITPFGAFVDLGGVDGMLHRTEMAGDGPLPEPAEVLTVGQPLRVRVLELGQQISVSQRDVPQER